MPTPRQRIRDLSSGGARDRPDDEENTYAILAVSCKESIHRAASATRRVVGCDESYESHLYPLLLLSLLFQHLQTVWTLPIGHARYPIRWKRTEEESTRLRLERGGFRKNGVTRKTHHTLRLRPSPPAGPAKPVNSSRNRAKTRNLAARTAPGFIRSRADLGGGAALEGALPKRLQGLGVELSTQPAIQQPGAATPRDTRWPRASLSRRGQGRRRAIGPPRPAGHDACAGFRATC